MGGYKTPQTITVKNYDKTPSIDTIFKYFFLKNGEFRRTEFFIYFSIRLFTHFLYSDTCCFLLLFFEYDDIFYGKNFSTLIFPYFSYILFKIYSKVILVLPSIYNI